MHTHPQIAIDGPAGVGKSTIGERLARRLGYLYIDTGAFYRALTYAALRQGIAPEDASALATLAHAMELEITPPTEEANAQDGRQYTVLLAGEDITPMLRTPAVESAISRVSSPPAVREALIERMRTMADDRGVVMVGRDIGTVVLPEADLKIYLTTSIEERAKRRHGDLLAKYGAEGPSREAVWAEIAKRDARDAPQMRPAPDAIGINNDHLQADEVVDQICQLLETQKRMGDTLKQSRIDEGTTTHGE